MSTRVTQTDESATLAYGLKITHYRLMTQAAPGFVALLFLFRSSLTPDGLNPFVAEPSWERLVGIGVPLLLLALPAGFVISGLSYFSLGWLVFSLRLSLCRRWCFGFVKRALTNSVGAPTLGPALATAETRRWVRYANDVAFIIQGRGFRGPRQDAPEKVIAVAIFARSCAFLALLYSLLRLTGRLPGESSAGEVAWVVGSFWMFAICAAAFELYRDYALLIAAEQFRAYPVLGEGNRGISEALEIAWDRFQNPK